MKKIKAKIADNRKVSKGFYRMRVQSEYLGRNTGPGQFFEVKCPDGSGAFLRRPLGAHRIHKDGVEMLYETVGKGTLSLSKMKAGRELDIIGPLGSGFDITGSKSKDRAAILIAGGIGVAPLAALAESLAHSSKLIADRKRIRVFIGGKTKSHILCEKEFKKLGCEVSISTEDGSKGVKGLVTGLLEKVLRTANSEQRTTIYACGPIGMLKAVAGIAAKRGLPCQVSMEERMACGIGVCLGCPVKVRTQYARRNTQYEYRMVCKDGPVFNAKEIAW